MRGAHPTLRAGAFPAAPTPALKCSQGPPHPDLGNASFMFLVMKPQEGAQLLPLSCWCGWGVSERLLPEWTRCTDSSMGKLEPDCQVQVPPPSCVTLGKSLNLSGLQRPPSGPTPEGEGKTDMCKRPARVE